MNGPAARRRALATAVWRGLFVLALAAWGALWAQQLSKEYIHAGERLLAVKVPASMPVGGALTATLTADPVLITAGDEVTLRWETTGALSATLTEGGGQDAGTVTPLEGGSLTVTPSADTTYTLTVTGEAGTITINPGITASLTAEPFLLATGETSTLTWTTTGATSATLSQDVGTDIGEVAETDLASGSEDVTPDETTTYTLSASGDSGAATATATISVGPSATLTATPNTIEAGETSTLSWTTTGATSATLNPGGLTIPVTELAMGDEDVTPDETTTYELTARNSEGILATAITDVTVGDDPPPPITIDSFTVDDPTPAHGDDVMFTWTTTGATRVRLQQNVSSAWEDIDGDRAADGNGTVSPPSTPQSRSYRIVAYSADDSEESASIQVTWPDPDLPVIDSFTSSDGDATPLVITDGDTTKLKWETSNATTVTLNDNPVALDNTSGTDFSPTSDTTYTLKATNSDGSSDESLEIEVVDAPVIVTFHAPGKVTSGVMAMLSWSTTGAVSATLKTDVSETITTETVDVNSSKEITLTADTTYTLTAVNKDGTQVSATKTVEVVLAPAIDSFTADDDDLLIGPNDDVDLEWMTTNATEVSITNTTISGSASVDSSTTVSPTATQTTYTLTASNDADTPATATDSITITIRPTAQLTANPEEIFAPNEAVELTWSTSHATSITIDPDPGVGTLTPVSSGSVTVYPGSTTTYTLTAKGPGGTATATAEVTNPDQRRSIRVTLTADPTSITRGGATTLSWTTTNADSATLSQDVGEDIGSVTPVASGSRSVSPTATTVYTLTATWGKGEDADSASATVKVTVTEP